MTPPPLTLTVTPLPLTLIVAPPPPLTLAVQLDPDNVRAHYGAGIVHNLQRRWPSAQASFQRASELATEPAERGSALYCLAQTLHAQVGEAGGGGGVLV